MGMGRAVSGAEDPADVGPFHVLFGVTDSHSSVFRLQNRTWDHGLAFGQCDFGLPSRALVSQMQSESGIKHLWISLSL